MLRRGFLGLLGAGASIPFIKAEGKLFKNEAEKKRYKELADKIPIELTGVNEYWTHKPAFKIVNTGKEYYTMTDMNLDLKAGQTVLCRAIDPIPTKILNSRIEIV